MPGCAQTAIAALVIVGPAVCVWRLGALGIFIGAVASWVVGVAADLVITNPDPEAGPIAALWLRYGWAVTVAYAAVLFAVMWLLRKATAKPPTI